jgi:hypothetical protein
MGKKGLSSPGAEGVRDPAGAPHIYEKICS